MKKPPQTPQPPPSGDLSDAVAGVRRLGQRRKEVRRRFADHDFQAALEELSARVARERNDARGLSNYLLMLTYMGKATPNLSATLQDALDGLSHCYRSASCCALVNSLWSLAKVLTWADQVPSVSDKRWLVDAAVEKALVEGSALDIAKLAWACATLELKDDACWMPLGRVVLNRWKLFDARGVANLVWSFATARQLVEKEVFRAAADTTLCRLLEFETQGLANVAWALGKESARAESFWHELAQGVAPRLREFTGQEFANMLWAFAAAAVMPENLQTPALVEASRRLSILKPQELSNVVWAFATAKVNHGGLCAEACSASMQRMKEFKITEVTALLWSMATLRCEDEACYRSGANVAIHGLEHVAGAEASQLVWAFATVQLACPPLFDAVATHIGQGRPTLELSPQAACNLAWAFIVMRQLPSPAATAIRKYTVAAIGKFTEADISSIAWAFATASEEGCEEILAACCEQLLERGGPQEVRSAASVAWALATTTTQQPTLFERLQAVVRTKLREASGQDLSNFLWAWATCGVEDVSTFAASAKALQARLSEMEPQGLANCAWALASVAVEDQGLVRHLALHAAERFDELKPQEVANLMWAVANLALLDSAVDTLATKAAGRLQEELQTTEPGATSTSKQASVDALSMVWALKMLGRLTDELREVARTALLRFGRQLDGGVSPRPTSARSTVVRPEDFEADALADGELPFTVACFHDREVVFKPPDWEVRTFEKPDHSAEHAAQPKQLVDFLREQDASGSVALEAAPAAFVKSPLLFDTAHRFGIMHRLDIPSSGLVLRAKTYEAYYDLALQLHTGLLDRDYVVLCHGWAPPSLRHISRRVRSHAEADCQWLAAETMVKVLAHASVPHLAAQQQLASMSCSALSLLGLRILTGRRHQIRVHTSHVGLPTVTDGRYTSAPTFRADQMWCPRNFLHRYRLSFLDKLGLRENVSVALPVDLATALGKTAGRCRASAAAIAAWLSSSPIASAGDDGMPTAMISNKSDAANLGSWQSLVCLQKKNER
eukprot:TRINITY_DN28503_c0_g1_i2.p1 TRINITY_DN28503_c0_g1~~TRINITY_DN28503_c0_g1_i2.p1  ORF type:complete len:1022 (+),score=192.07 TRINITY_DN28503_c0_g1_i2:209-3274(+)